MPHQCTDCDRSFPDGSTEMLSGCPDCGGTTFQYRPDGDTDPTPPDDPPDPPVDGSVARTVGSAATAVRDLVGTSDPDRADPDLVGTSDPDRTDPDLVGTSDPDRVDPPAENAAQASARSEVVGTEDLPPAPEEPPATVHSTPDSGLEAGDGADNRPDLRTLREELNDQFESIRVVEPGQYELNLMELYDREEYIIALQEDGKYTIQVPERWAEK